MATLYIAEFTGQPNSLAGIAVPAAQQPYVATQTVAIGGLTTQSQAFQPQTRFVRVHTDAICSIAWGTSPTATTASPRMAADHTEYFGVNGGDKLAVISNT